MVYMYCKIHVLFYMYYGTVHTHIIDVRVVLMSERGMGTIWVLNFKFLVFF